MRKKLLTAALVLGSVYGLTACTPSFPAASPAPVEVNREAPNLADPQIIRVLNGLNDAVAAANKESNPALLDARVQDPALISLKAMFILHGLDGNIPLVSFPAKNISTTVTNSPTWPHAILNVAGENGSKDIYVQILRQDSPTQAYRLWQYTKLLPKTEFPATATIAQGTKQLAVESSDDLLMSPLAALDAWANTALNPQAPEAPQVALDAFTTALRKQQSDLNAAIGDNGTVSFALNRFNQPGDVMAFELPSKQGALVAGYFNYVGTLTDVDSSRPITLSNRIDLLIGDGGKVTANATWNRQVAVLLLVPPRGVKDAKVRLLAVDSALTAASSE